MRGIIKLPAWDFEFLAWLIFYYFLFKTKLKWISSLLGKNKKIILKIFRRCWNRGMKSIAYVVISNFQCLLGFCALRKNGLNFSKTQSQTRCHSAFWRLLGVWIDTIWMDVNKNIGIYRTLVGVIEPDIMSRLSCRKRTQPHRLLFLI